MLIPALLSFAFRPPKKRGFSVEKEPEKHPREVVLELSELLPEINETIELALLYFNSLDETKGDNIDVALSRIVRDLQGLQTLVQLSKTRGLRAILDRIKSEIARLPKEITHILYHSKLPSQQAELAQILSKHGSLVHADSLLRDILTFIRTYCTIRWKGAEALKTHTTAKVHETIKK